MTATIYLIRLYGEPKYVGFTTTTINKRWKQHCHNADVGKKTILCNSIRKHGKDTFSIENIFSHENDQYVLKEMEPKFILEHNTFVDNGGYNMTHGGEGILGYVFTEETRSKMSKSRIGKKNTEETLSKMSKSAKNRPPISEQTRENLRIAWRTRPPITEETREKLSITSKGRIRSKESIKRGSNSLRDSIRKRGGFTDEHKKNLSVGSKGKNKTPWSEERKKERVEYYKRKKNTEQ